MPTEAAKTTQNTPPKYYSSGDIANALGVTRDVIVNLIRSNEIPESFRSGHTRCFSAEAVDTIRTIIKNRKPRKRAHAAGN